MKDTNCCTILSSISSNMLKVYKRSRCGGNLHGSGFCLRYKFGVCGITSTYSYKETKIMDRDNQKNTVSFCFSLIFGGVFIWVSFFHNFDSFIISNLSFLICETLLYHTSCMELFWKPLSPNMPGWHKGHVQSLRTQALTPSWTKPWTLYLRTKNVWKYHEIIVSKNSIHINMYTCT